MFKRILLATDGSAVAERAILYAGHLARSEQAEIVVLHAYYPPELYATYSGYDGLIAQYRQVARAIVDDAVGALHDDGIVARGEIGAGEAADVILRAIGEHDISLVVLGRHDSGNLQELLGGTSARVLRHAPCPVLQVP